MKTTISKIKMGALLLLTSMCCLVISCSKDEAPVDPPPAEGGDGNAGGENPGEGENENNLEELNSLIANLSYDADVLLNVQNTGSLVPDREETSSRNDNQGPTEGWVTECKIKDYNLESNFDDVAILRPTNGVIFPGALVIGNDGMLDGAPDPLTLDRSAVTLSIDLPGIGDQGTIVVEDPTNSSVQSSIDNALEWWNANAYQEGYVNAANSSYQATTSYSSKQFSLDVGLNVEWASGSLASQFEFESNRTERTAAIVFKQVFYTVTMDTPSSAASVFAPAVTKEQAEAAFDSDTPPAYVSSVSYGRVIMVRMQTTEEDTSIELDAVLEYAGGYRAAGSLESKYDEILKNSSVTVVTIGGNAEAASEAISLADINTGFGALNSVITGGNAVYSRNNPGVPIAYTIRYLKDNTLAKMGYTTDYTVEKCGSFRFEHKNIVVENESNYDTRFRFIYKLAGNNDELQTGFVEVNNDKRVSGSPPDGAYDVLVQFDLQNALFQWDRMGEFDLGYIRNEEDFRVFCSERDFIGFCKTVSVEPN
ncbi:thiol-activated cytolysin family protein [Ulvibacterium sp.]|uniref:thiol-activated cytolysin family protein n=1 Tax=Ulvibacterium sp. TaxID=2665914 RepID=UPI002637F043|nr:thiol-activated cytolysin family protein [Ulvibacterium sp.]